MPSATRTVTTRSLRKSSRVRRLSEKAMNCDNKDQLINSLIDPDHNHSRQQQPQQQQQPLLKKRKLSASSTHHQFEQVNNFNFINLKIGNVEEEEDFLLNLGNGNEIVLNNLDEELKETELRISNLFQSSQLTDAQAQSPVSITSPTTSTTTTTTTTEVEKPETPSSLEEFLDYDLMPSLAESESDSETSTTSTTTRTPTTSASATHLDYLPQCFDYRSNHASVNLSLIQVDSSTKKADFDAAERRFVNAIKKRSGDVFLTDGMFDHFF